MITDGSMELTFSEGTTSVFNAYNIHMHQPSEHTLEGELLDLEVHFVHLYPDGGLGAVIGVFFDRDQGGDQDNYFIEQMIMQRSSAQSITGSGNFQLFIKNYIHSIDTNNFFSYDGSLTTPPCTEGIKWSVMKEVQPISARQLEYFSRLWGSNSNFAPGVYGNNRLVQPLNDRTLRESFPYWDMSKNTWMGVAVAFIVLFLLSVVASGVFCCCQCMKNKKASEEGGKSRA